MTLTIDTDRDVLMIDGISFSLELFRMFIQPNPDILYRFERVDDVIVATEIRSDTNGAS